MRRIFPMTACFALGALAALSLPPGSRGLALSVLGLLYLGLCTWGTVSLRSKVFVEALTWARTSRPEVCLTYDDGPDPHATPALLDFLKSREVPATFFVVGKRALAHPEVVRRCHREGHLIGNHTQSHSYFTNFYCGRRLRHELLRCQRTITQLTGTEPVFYRPPVGLVNVCVRRATWELGLEIVGWQVRSLDTTGRTVEEVVERILRRIRPGGIVLLHDGNQDPLRVVAITARVLDGLAARGLTPVRLDRLVVEEPLAG